MGFIYIFYIIGLTVAISIFFFRFSNLLVRFFNKKIYNNYKYYTKKKIMTNYEKYFYDIFTELEKEYYIRVQPQVNLASIINITSNNKNILELFKNIDFGIFTKDYEHLLVLIEINDKTHNLPNRITRDKKVKKIVDEAGIKLITFYSNYPNSKEYVKNRIKKELNLK